MDTAYSPVAKPTIANHDPVQAAHDRMLYPPVDHLRQARHEWLKAASRRFLHYLGTVDAGAIEVALEDFEEPPADRRIIGCILRTLKYRGWVVHAGYTQSVRKGTNNGTRSLWRLTDAGRAHPPEVLI